MKHMQLHGKKQYRYDTAPDGEVVRLEVYYSLGGANYFTGTTDRRGVYASLRPLKKERQPNGVTYESFTLMKGTKMFVAECQSFSPRRLQDVAELVDDVAPEITALYLTNPEVALKQLREKTLEYSTA